MSTTYYAYGGGHVAHLDVITGQGLVVRPMPEDDVTVPTSRTLVLDGEAVDAAHGSSIHAADWHAALRHLAGQGWAVLEDEEDGLPVVAGWTIDGREVVGLYCETAMCDDLEMLAAADAELCQAAGVVQLA